MSVPKMKDMALTQEQKVEGIMPTTLGEMNSYPWGLRLSISDDQLEKLDLEGDCEVGDFLHLFALAKVVSVSKNDTGDGEKTRIELQITHMGIEDEDYENEAEQVSKNKPRKLRLYKK